MLDLEELLRRLDSLGMSRAEVDDATRAMIRREPPRHIIDTEWMLFTVLQAVADMGPSDLGLKLGGFWENDVPIYAGEHVECRSLAEASQACKTYLLENQQIHLFRDEIEKGEWRLTFATRFPHSASSILLIDEILARWKYQTEYLLGGMPATKRIEFSRPAPAHKQVYEDFFGCPVIWGRPHTMVVLDQGYLYEPLIDVSGDTAGAVPGGREACSDLGSCQDHSKIASAILEMLVFSPGSYPSLLGVADKFGVSASTVKRRLLTNASNYRELVDDVRRDHVARYLAFSDLPPKEIAHRIGFSNVHNFRRAFSRWMDQTPNQYRRAVRQAGVELH